MRKSKISENHATKDPANIHEHHDHQHGGKCALKGVQHGDRVDQVFDGHLHRIQGRHLNEIEEDDVQVSMVREIK